MGTEIIKKAIIHSGMNKGRIRNPLVAQEEANTILTSVGNATPEGYRIDRKAKRALDSRKSDFILTAQAAVSEEYRQQTEIDELTQLPNKKGILRRIHEAISRHDRFGTRYEVLFMDIDGFRTFNNSYGHQEGDKMLEGFATYMKREGRAYEGFGRWGGDEFVLILESPSPESAEEVTKRITNYFSNTTLTDSRYSSLGMSIGSRTLEPGEHRDAYTLLENADAAMYEAKKQHGTVLIPWKDGMKAPPTSTFHKK